jgi:hypothetical protein
MALLPEPTDTHLPITPEEAKAALHTEGLVWGDDPALRILIMDMESAEQSQLSKAWVAGWDQANILYQSPYSQRYWTGTMTEAASVPFYTVATSVNALVPQIINGLFYENPPFMIEERSGTTAQAARAISAILAYQLEDIDFKTELRLGTMNAVLYGTEIWAWGWEQYTKVRKLYKQKNPPLNIPSSIPGAPDTQIDDDEYEEVVEKELVDRPTFEHIVNLKEVLVDPTLEVPDIRKAKFVIRRRYVTWKDLDKLRERPGFDIPSQEKLLELFLPPVEPVQEAVNEDATKNPLWDIRADSRYHESTVNPFDQPLELLERTDDSTYTVVLNRKVVICNTENEYGKINYLSVNWWDVPGAFWGMGLGRTIGSEQRLQQGLTNLMLDDASLNLNSPLVRVRGKSIPTQNIRIAPGKIIDVEDKDGLKPLDRRPAVPEAQAYLVLSQARAEQVSGANEAASQGVAGPSGHSNLARSAAGANLIASGSGNRISDFVEKLCDQVLVPFLYEVYEMDRAMLPPSQFKYILNDELQHAYLTSGGSVLDLLNARVKFSILAGAKMAVRRNMAQSLPLLMQTLFNAQITEQLSIAGMKIEIMEFLRMWLEAGEWKNEKDLIVPMTPQDQQRLQAMQPAAAVAAKGQQVAQQSQQQFAQKQQLVDQENEARAARDVMRMTFEKAAEPEALTGDPGGTAFGSNE